MSTLAFVHFEPIAENSQLRYVNWQVVGALMIDLAERLNRAKFAWERADLADGRDACEEFVSMLDEHWDTIMFALRAVGTVPERLAS